MGHGILRSGVSGILYLVDPGIHDYVAAYGGPANFSSRLNQVATKWNASGELSFMNEWCVSLFQYEYNILAHCSTFRTYKLGEESTLPVHPCLSCLVC